MTIGRKVAPPDLGRSVQLHFQGDWGRANLHRALGWLSYQIGTLSGPDTRVAIWNGRGGRDNLQAVGTGQVDVALVVPEPFLPVVLGNGPYALESYSHVRALGHVPQHDRMVVAVRRELGIASFADWRRLRPDLRVAMGPQDSVSFIGLGARIVLSAAGIPMETIRIVENEEPRACCRDVVEGRADAIIMEAVMTDYFRAMTEAVDLQFIPLEDHEKRYLADIGLATATLPASYLRGIDREMEFVDFSHFLLVTTTDLPDDVAYALAWSLIEGWEVLERQYRHLPPDRSPVSYPIDPSACARSSIALHPGAKRYYQDAGYL